MKMQTWQKVVALVVFLILGNVLVGIGVTTAYAGVTGQEKTPAHRQQQQVAQRPQAGQQRGLVAIAIAISIGTACAGAGYAVGRVGSAAIGAASENPEMLTRSLIFVALAEGIAIYGLLVAILLWVKF